MEPSRRVGLGLLGVGAVLLAHGYIFDAVLAVDAADEGIARRPLYVAAASVGAVASIGAAVRLLYSRQPPSIQDGIVLTVVAALGTPLLSTVVDPAFHSVLIDQPLSSVRGLGRTVVTTPGAILGDSPGPTTAAILAPTVLVGVAAGHRDRTLTIAGGSLTAGVLLVTAGTGTSLWAPFAYLLLLGEPDLLSVPGGGWLLALVAPVAAFVAVDALRAAETAATTEQ